MCNDELYNLYSLVNIIREDEMGRAGELIKGPDETGHRGYAGGYY
jgi:hypothetical protein